MGENASPLIVRLCWLLDLRMVVNRKGVIQIRILTFAITPGTSVPEWHGEQMDDGVAVDMLLQCE